MKFVKYDEDIPIEKRKFGDISHLITKQLMNDVNELNLNLNKSANKVIKIIS